MQPRALLAAALLAGCSGGIPVPPQSDGGPGFDAVEVDGQVAGTDTTGKGAVLCAWRIYAGALEIGELCHPGEDVALKAELARSVTLVERFIVANSSLSITQAGLDAQKAEGLAELNGHAICATDAVQLYHGLRDAGAEALRAGVDDLLSVPREPVLNPCL